MIGSVFFWTCGQLLQITCYKQNMLVDNWTIDLVGLKLRLEKVFLSASFDGRQQMKFNMGGLVIGRTRGGQLKRSKGPLPAGWSVSVYPQNVATV